MLDLYFLQFVFDSKARTWTRHPKTSAFEEPSRIEVVVTSSKLNVKMMTPNCHSNFMNLNFTKSRYQIRNPNVQTPFKYLIRTNTI